MMHPFIRHYAIQDHQFRMLWLKEHRLGVLSVRAVLKKVLRPSCRYLFRFGEGFYPCLDKCRGALVSFSQGVITAVGGSGQRVNCGRVSVVKPKENRAFKLALRHCLDWREQLSCWRSRVPLWLWGAQSSTYSRRRLSASTSWNIALDIHAHS